MYVFLLALGAVITAAGMALVAAGASAHEGALDATVMTPGMIAAVGGLLLIGLGIAVRVLERIERALLARPMPRAVRPGEAAAIAAHEQPNAPVRIPLPPKPEARPPPLPAAAVAATPAEDGPLEQVREKAPNLARIETPPLVEEKDVPLLPKAPAHAEEDVGQVNGVAPGRTNGVAPPRIAPRLEATALSANGAAEHRKGSLFDTLWPKTPRNGRAAQAAPARVVVPPQVEQAQEVAEPQPEAEAVNGVHVMRVPVSILKSGVVDGMAYTLYSDGSIEAQLPQGRLRFGSITELRNHLEHGS